MIYHILFDTFPPIRYSTEINFYSVHFENFDTTSDANKKHVNELDVARKVFIIVVVDKIDEFLIRIRWVGCVAGFVLECAYRSSLLLFLVDVCKQPFPSIK